MARAFKDYASAQSQWMEQTTKDLNLPQSVLENRPAPTLKTQQCPDCRGKGAIELFTSTNKCSRCEGKGEILVDFKPINAIKLSDPPLLHQPGPFGRAFECLRTGLVKAAPQPTTIDHKLHVEPIAPRNFNS